MQAITSRSERWNWLAVCTAALAASCASEPSLTPAPDATIVENDGVAAQAVTENITLTAEAGAWRTGVDIEQAVTPLKVTIENGSDRNLSVRYSEFGLVTETGNRYAALPPYGVRGSITEPVMTKKYPPLSPVGFHHSRFRIAAHYSFIYPTLSPYASSRIYYDPYYYRHYYPYWRRSRVRVELPTPEMLRRALPEGVLEAGGELEGFLYFEKIPGSVAGERVRFHADLLDAMTGERFATLHIPFVASGPDAARAERQRNRY